MMNERQSTVIMAGLIQITETYVTDYIKMTSEGKAKTNETIQL